MRGRVLIVGLAIIGSALSGAACADKGSPEVGAQVSDRPVPEQVAHEPPMEPPKGAWVVLDKGTTLYHSPSADEHSTIGSVIERDDIAWDRGRLVEVEDEFGPFIQVRTIDGGHACAGSFGSDDRVRLRFYVRKDDLGSVLRVPKSWEFDDGTAVELQPGTPVRGVGEEAEALVLGAVFDVDIAAHELGQWYERPARPWTPPAEVAGTVSYTVKLHYGPHELRIMRGPSWPYQREWTRGDRRLVKVDNACGRFTLGVERSMPSAWSIPWPMHSMPQNSRLYELALNRRARMGQCSPGKIWIVPRGATLAWKSTGLEAGEVVEDLSLDMPPQEGEDGRWCFWLDGQFEVCTKATVRPSRRTCEGKGGAGG